MTTREPEPENPEVKEGDVAEEPTKPDEDGSDPHLSGVPHTAPRDPAHITDAHPSNQPQED